MIKTTLLGGILFLIPFGILLLILDEVLGLLIWVATPLISLFPEGDYVAGALSVVIDWVLVFLICFIAGLAARHAAASGFSSKTDTFLAGIVPGYGMLRNRIAATLNNETFGTTRQVVVVESGGLKRWAFLISENEMTNEALLFLPNSPNADTGTLGTVPISAIKRTDIPPHVLIREFEFYGRGLLADTVGGRRVETVTEKPT